VGEERKDINGQSKDRKDGNCVDRDKEKRRNTEIEE
jgi:hypothetical protein